MNKQSADPYRFHALVIFFFSFILRLFLISAGPYHIDCLALSINAQKTLDTFALEHQFGPGYPLTIITGSMFLAFLRLFSLDDPVLAVNFMSVTLSSLTVLVFYHFLKNTINARAGMYGALFLSLHPIFLSLSVYGNSHIVCVFFLILSLYFLTCPFLKARYIYFSLALGLMGAGRVQDMVLMIIPIGLFWLFREKTGFRDRIKHIPVICLYLALSGLIAGLFHLPYIIGNAHDQYAGQFKYFCVTGVAQTFHGLLSPILYQSFTTIGYATSLPGILLSWYGLIRMFRNKTDLAILVLFWFWVPLLLYGNITITVTRYYLISIVPLCLAIAYGIEQLMERKKSPVHWAIAASCAIVALAGNVTNSFPILAFRHSRALLPEWSHYIRNHTEKNAVLISGDDAFIINHYSGRNILSRPEPAFFLENKDIADFKRILDEKLKSEVPVYITTCGLYCYDPDKKFSNFMKSSYRLINRGRGITEDWHNGELILDLWDQKLFKVEKNKPEF